MHAAARPEITLSPLQTRGADGQPIDTGQTCVKRNGTIIGFFHNVDGATLFIHRTYPAAVLDQITQQARQLAAVRIDQVRQLPPPPQRQHAAAEDFDE